MPRSCVFTLADETWTFVTKDSDKMTKSNTRARLFKKHPNAVLCRPPLNSSATNKQYRLLCMEQGCMRTQQLHLFRAHGFTKCEFHRFETFHGVRILKKHLYENKHLLVKVSARRRKDGSIFSYSWHKACQNQGCKGLVNISEAKHAQRLYCFSCEYVSPERIRRGRRYSTSNPHEAIVAYGIGIKSGHKSRFPLARCSFKGCDELVRFLPRRHVNYQHLGMCRACAGRSRRLPLFKVAYANFMATSKKRGIENTISFEAYTAFRNADCCHYCQGSLPSSYRHDHTSHRSTHFIDRKDSALGYSEENCVSCCASCNRLKFSSMSYEEMLVICAMRKGSKQDAQEALILAMKKKRGTC